MIKETTVIGTSIKKEKQEAHSKNVAFVLLRQKEPKEQKIPSWTGFNILIRNGNEVSKDTISYLPTINMPATDMSTAYKVLESAKRIKEELNLSEVDCVLDLAFYIKVAEVAWAHPEQYDDIILRLGIFHVICNYMSVIGKRFGAAGLRDLAVESGIIAEGSVNQMLEGTMYNRAIRFHKLLYEALMCIAWKEFFPWLEKNHQDELELFHSTIEKLGDLHAIIADSSSTKDGSSNCSEALNKFLDDESCALFWKGLTLS